MGSVKEVSWFDGRKIAAFILLLTPLIVAIAFPVQPVQAQSSRFYTRQSVSADLTEAYEILRRYHPNFTRHNSAKQQRALFEKLQRSIPQSVSKEEAYLLLSEFVGAVCDEHTQIIKRRADNTIMPPGWPWFEQPLFVRGGKLFIEDEFSKAKEEVVSINGVRGVDIASHLSGRMPNDGCVGNGVIIVNGFLRVGGHIVNALIGTDGPYWVTVVGHESGKQKGRTVEAITSLRSRIAYSSFSKSQTRDIAIELLVKKFSKRDLGKEVRTADLTYLYSERRKMAYLKVDSFKKPDIAREGIERVMRDIIKNRPDALILDFTQNPGGYTETAQFFMAFLLPRAHRLHSRAFRKDVSKKLPDNFRFSNKSAKDAHEYDLRIFTRIRKKKRCQERPGPAPLFRQTRLQGEDLCSDQSGIAIQRHQGGIQSETPAQGCHRWRCDRRKYCFGLCGSQWFIPVEIHRLHTFRAGTLFRQPGEQVCR